MMISNIVQKIKMYMFPEDLLDIDSYEEYRLAENKKNRDHILLISFIVLIVYPLYYILYDKILFDAEQLNYHFIHRSISTVAAVIGILFYFNYKKLSSRLYKLPFLILCTIVILGQAVMSYMTIKTTTFIPYILIMVLAYTIKPKPVYSFVYGLILASIVSIIIIAGGRSEYIMISNSVCTMAIIILFSLRNYTSIRQFLENKKLTSKIVENNNYLNSTYNQLIHDVKSPLMALKHISSKDDNGSSLLKTATQRVEKIILELEEGQKLDNKQYKYSVKNCINDIISEAKIRYKNLLSETKIELSITNDLEYEVLFPITNIEFSRIASNIINNAFEAKNSRTHTISISAQLCADKFLFIISDNGRGIKLNDNLSIFAEGYSTKGSNRGYGLSHAKKVVTQSGGEIEVNGENGFEIKINFDLDNLNKRTG